MKDKKRIIVLTLLIIAILCLAGAIILFVVQAIEDKKSEEALGNFRLNTNESISDIAQDISKLTTELSENVSQTALDTAVINPYADSFLANEDMVAWLTIPGTNIDYPVMWTPFDENYYLYRDFNGNENANGCLLLDTDSSLNPLTTNLIIHGHNMKSGAMFGNLTDYENKDFFDNHKEVILHTRESQKNYEIIAVFRSQVYKKTDDVFKFYKFFQANTQEEFDNFYNNIKALSIYDTGITATYGDNFITLSTCVYHVQNGRFVVIAKEVKPGNIYLPVFTNK